MKTFKLLILVFALISSAIAGETFGAAASNMTQSVAGGGVTAKVTFLNPQSASEPRFQVVLDTHSVNLDAYDLKSIAVLRDDTGKSYVPTAAENKGSGHHREATITFPKLSPGAKRIEMVVKDVAGVKERVFAWNLE